MAQSKSTKKFEKHHLKDVLKKRKEGAKIKQRHQQAAKRKERRAKDNEKDEAVLAEQEKAGKKQKSGKEALNDMSVDDFFAGGFEIPKAVGAKGGLSRSGKRKRSDEKEKEDDASSVASVEDHALAAISGSEAGSGDEGDDMDTHKGDLKALAEKDPEFFKYLQENDAELLDFEDTNLDEIDELSGSEEEEEETKPKKGKKKAAKEEEDITAKGEISLVTVKKWSAAMKDQYSLRAMREVVLAFRAAAHLNEEDGKQYKYTISDSNVYHELLLCALKQIPAVLQHHLPVKEHANGKTRISTDSKKFRTLSQLLKSHAASVQHLLETLSDAATLKTTLSSLLALLPYTLSFKKLVRDLSRVVVDIWSDSAHSEATRISAFLVLRRLTVIGDPTIRETVLRTTYQGLIKGSRTTTIHNLAGLNLMKNSAAELWGLVDPNIAYTTGFTFIRQLAIHLRNSIKNNSNDSYKTVYNWQYVHSLDFWSRVLSTHCESLREATVGKESPLRPLIYPFTQVALGAMRLIPTAAYFPLRFHLIRALLRVSAATNTFIPLATPLYEVLTSAEMKKPPKPSTVKPLDFETNIRAMKSLLRTRIYQDGVGEQVAELLAEFFTLWSRSIAFPELALPVVVMLKRWLKEVSPYNHNAAAHNAGKRGKGKKTDASGAAGNKNMKVNGMFTLLIQKLDANSRWIEERRARVDFAPNDRAGVEGFLKEVEWTKTPLGAFVEGQRKSREEKRKMLEEGRRDEEKRKAEDRAKGKVGKVEVDDEGFEGAASDEEEGEEEMEMENENEVELEGEDEDMEDMVDGSDEE